MNTLILQLDGKIPNLALMRIAAHERALGHSVTFRKINYRPDPATLHGKNRAAIGAKARHLQKDPLPNPYEEVEPLAFDPKWDRVYASAVFDRTRPLADRVKTIYPNAIIGGSGYDLRLTLADVGIPEDTAPDYSDFDPWKPSIGFAMRGCPRRCGFCRVPEKEGRQRSVSTVSSIWRGDPWPKRVMLLDNNFFANPEWRERVEEIVAHKFQVSLSQGIDLRSLTEEQAEAIVRIRPRTFDFLTFRIYAAWDSTKDEAQVFRGLERLKVAGWKPINVLVYILVGFDGTTPEDWLYRANKLNEFGARPYPMPFTRDPAVLGFVRWISFGQFRRVSWDDFARAGYQGDLSNSERAEMEANQRDLFLPRPEAA